MVALTTLRILMIVFVFIIFCVWLATTAEWED